MLEFEALGGGQSAIDPLLVAYIRPWKTDAHGAGVAVYMLGAAHNFPVLVAGTFAEVLAKIGAAKAAAHGAQS